MVAAVATLEPLVAENSAEAPMFEFIRPPGNHDSHLSAAPYMGPATPEQTSSSPIRMYNGIATSRNSAPVLQAISPMALLSGNVENSSASDMPSRPTLTAAATLRPSKPSSTIRANTSI